MERKGECPSMTQVQAKLLARMSTYCIKEKADEKKIIKRVKAISARALKFAFLYSLEGNSLMY